MTNVVYSPDFTSTEYRLMELGPELLQLIENGEELSFKGNESDAMVLCSADKTFDIKLTSTSNTVYISEASTKRGSGTDIVFDEETPDFVLHGSINNFLETVEGVGRVETINTLLIECPYAGPMAEREAHESKQERKKTYTLDMLVNVVQASVAEIMTALKKLGAFELDGCWRVLDQEYSATVFSLILTSAIAEDWSLDYLDEEVVTKSLAEHNAPGFVIRALLELYGDIMDSPADTSTTIFKLDRAKICSFEANRLFIGCTRWPLEAFVETWQGNLPEGVSADLKYLEGTALLSSTVEGSKEVLYFPAAQLPIDIKKRVTALFKQKTTWNFAEISPYLTDVATKTLTVEKILFKYSRSYKDSNGNKLYSKR